MILTRTSDVAVAIVPVRLVVTPWLSRVLQEEPRQHEWYAVGENATTTCYLTINGFRKVGCHG